MHPGAARVADLLGVLGEAALIAANRAARATFRAADRRKGGKNAPNRSALAARGANADRTPMWDALSAQLGLALRKRGARARLARHLGLPRQRVTDFTKGRRTPDAETALRLLHWLAAARSGEDVSGLVPPDPDRFPPAARSGV
jgi:hypothetical protein